MGFSWAGSQQFQSLVAGARQQADSARSSAFAARDSALAQANTARSSALARVDAIRSQFGRPASPAPAPAAPPVASAPVTPRPTPVIDPPAVNDTPGPSTGPSGPPTFGPNTPGPVVQGPSVQGPGPSAGGPSNPWTVGAGQSRFTPPSPASRDPLSFDRPYRQSPLAPSALKTGYFENASAMKQPNVSQQMQPHVPDRIPHSQPRAGFRDLLKIVR